MKIKNALKVLGFENLTVIPKMKDIRKQWIKLSLIHHPDKPTGDTKSFQELLSAYETVSDEAKKMEYDKSDIEEKIARKMYDEFQFMSVRENLQTYTFVIEKDFINSWESVLSMNYGLPKDQQTSGKKFSVNDNCPDGGMIYLTLYHTGKILLQAEKNKHSINIHFVNVHLENLYTQVYKIHPQISVHGVKVPTAILKQSPVVKKTRSKSLSFKCKECDFVAPGTRSMKIHTKSLHKDNQQTPLQVSQPRAMHNCTFCHEEYHDEQQLIVHMKEMHNKLTDAEEKVAPAFYTKRRGRLLGSCCHVTNGGCALSAT